MNPITVEMLRDDWYDNADLTDAEYVLLGGLSDETLQDALDHAFTDYQDMWWHVLDNTRGDATRALLGGRKELGL